MRRKGALLGAALAYAPLGALGAIAPNVGVLESQVVPEGDHLGLYAYAGLSTTFEAGPFVAIPELLVEWTPENDRWGIVAVATFDHAYTPWFGGDLIVALAHDQRGFDHGSAAYGLGPGVGTTFTLGAWTLSPFAIFYKNLGVPGWTWTPGINVAWSPPDA